MSHLVYDAISQMLMKCLKGILGFNNMLLVHFFLYLNSYYLLLTQVLTRLGKTDSFKKTTTTTTKKNGEEICCAQTLCCLYHEAVHNTTCAYVFETEKGRPLLKDNRERWNLKPFPILFNVRRQENQEYLNKKTPQIIKRENKIIV